MSDLIERAEAMAERLDKYAPYMTKPKVAKREIEAAALIRELIAQVKAGEGMP